MEVQPGAVSPGRGKVASLIQNFVAPSSTGDTRPSSPGRTIWQQEGVVSQAAAPGSATASSPRGMPSPRSNPLALSAPNPPPRDRPRSRSGGSSPLVLEKGDGDQVELPAAISVGVPSPRTNPELRQREEDSGSGGPQPGGGSQGGELAPPRTAAGGKEWEWKRKALAGKGIVREDVQPRDGGGEHKVKLPLSSLLHTIETDRVHIPSSKSDSWKAKALTGRGIIAPSSTPNGSEPGAPSSASGHMASTTTSAFTSSPLSSTSLDVPLPSEREQLQQQIDTVANGDKKSGSKKGRHEARRHSRKEEKEKEKGKKHKTDKPQDKGAPFVSTPMAVSTTAEVSLPTTVVNRLHVDKDSLVQDMDGVLRTLRDELERLGNHNSPAPPSRGGGLRRHRRSKSIDNLASHQTLKPSSSPKASPTTGEVPVGDPFPRPATAREKPVSRLLVSPASPAPVALMKPTAGERKSKTNSQRQQLLLGKGVVRPEDKRTVPVSRLSVLIDMADVQAIHQQAAILEAASSQRPSAVSALLNCEYKPTREDLIRQRLKTVKAVIASSMDELHYELLQQRNSVASGEEASLRSLTSKLQRVSDILG